MIVSVNGFSSRPAIRVAFVSLISILLGSCSSESSVTSGPATVNSQANFQGAPAAGGQLNDNSVLIVPADNELYKVNALTGDSELLHKFSSGLNFKAPVDVVGNTIIATATDNTLNGIDINTGELLWEVGLGASDRTGGQSSPVCAGEVCYASGSGGEFGAYNVSTQQPGWSITDRKTRYTLIVGDYVIRAGDYYESNRSAIVVLNRHDGSEQHSIKLNDIAWGRPRVYGSMLFVPTEGTLEAYDISTWQLVWKAPFFGEQGFYRTGNLTFAGNVVAFNTTIDTDDDDSLDEYVLVGLDVNSGALMWSINSGEITSYRFDPQSDGTTIYSAVSEYYSVAGYSSKRGTPFAVDPATGNILWQSTEEISDDPTVAAGQLFVTRVTGSGGVGNFYSGFGSLDARNGAVSMRAPRVNDYDALAPVLVHNNQAYRPEPFVGWTDIP